MFKSAAVSISPLHAARLHARPGAGADPQQAETQAKAARHAVPAAGTAPAERASRVGAGERAARPSLEARAGHARQEPRAAGEGQADHAEDFQEVGGRLSLRL